jgi:hypothetical protein
MSDSDKIPSVWKKRYLNWLKKAENRLSFIEKEREDNDET